MMEKDAIVTQNLKDSLDSIKEIRVLNAESVFTEKYNASQKEFCNLGLKYVITTAAYSSLTSIASVLGHVIVLLCGTLSVYDGKMSVGTLISLNSIVALLYSPVERIVGFNRVLQAFKIEMAKLNDVLRKNISLDIPKKCRLLYTEQLSEGGNYIGTIQCVFFLRRTPYSRGCMLEF